MFARFLTRPLQENPIDQGTTRLVAVRHGYGIEHGKNLNRNVIHTKLRCLRHRVAWAREGRDHDRRSGRSPSGVVDAPARQAGRSAGVHAARKRTEVAVRQRTDGGPGVAHDDATGKRVGHRRKRAPGRTRMNPLHGALGRIHALPGGGRQARNGRGVEGEHGQADLAVGRRARPTIPSVK